MEAVKAVEPVKVEILPDCVWNERRALWLHLVIFHYPCYKENISLSHQEICGYGVMPPHSMRQKLLIEASRDNQFCNNKKAIVK
jgi:hypothetical protein